MAYLNSDPYQEEREKVGLQIMNEQLGIGWEKNKNIYHADLVKLITCDVKRWNPPNSCPDCFLGQKGEVESYWFIIFIKDNMKDYKICDCIRDYKVEKIKEPDRAKNRCCYRLVKK